MDTEAAPLAAAKFADQAARAKIALNGQFVLAMASYPFVVGFTFAARSGLLNVVKPAGVPSTGFDLWKTSDAASLVKTALSFTAVLAVHVVLLGHLLMMRLPGAPYLSRQCLVAGPMLLFFITINYFYTYGASTKEWYIFTVFTVLLVVITGWMYLVPIKQETVAKNGKEPEPAAQV